MRKDREPKNTGQQENFVNGRSFSRRDFLKISGIAFGGLALATPLGRAATALAESTSTTQEQKAKLTKAEFIGFSDVPVTHPYYEAINGMAQEGIISGFNDGTFGPDKLITRQQFAKIIVGAIDLPVSEQDICPFDDVMNGGPNDFYPDNYVAVVAKYGITLGKSPKKFAPLDNITRAQVDTMMIRAAQNLQPGRLATPPEGYQTMVDAGETHGGPLRVADYNGLLINLIAYNRFWNPFESATRGEVAQMLWNLKTYERQQKTGAGLLNIEQYNLQNIPEFLKPTLPPNVVDVEKIDAYHPVNASREIDFYLVHSSNETSFSWENPKGSATYINKKLAVAMQMDPRIFSTTLFFNYSSDTGGIDKLLTFQLLPKEGNETVGQYEGRALAFMTEIMQNHATNGVIRVNEIKDVLNQAIKLEVSDPNNPDSTGITYNRGLGQGAAIDEVVDAL
ncbi:MAG: hypothetical protein A2W22_01380 [Candidatus Levybacteria bacterium RBG_16_35_11]|nr:MAG: hypothetical protein A2W22_01380 [Candidatus Levybacteria bacterium RBG_16_35_11]